MTGTTGPRSPLAIVNELSWPSPNQVEAGGLVSSFVSMLVAAKKVRPDLALASQATLLDLPVAGLSAGLRGVLTAGGRPRTEASFLLAMAAHAPFRRAPGLTLVDDLEEYRWGGTVAHGLGIAASNAQLAVSFDPDAWAEAQVDLVHAVLEEDAETIREARVTATHASTPGHIRQHESFLREVALPRPFRGADLWADRDHLYPHVDFLPRVEGHLVALQGEALRKVAQRLGEMEAAVAEWVPGAGEPAWRSKHAAGEHDARQDLCWFDDLDGVRRNFDEHVYFTPGVGRIYFRRCPDGENPRVRVAHIGLKLGLRGT